jgi:hypothetical protein
MVLDAYRGGRWRWKARAARAFSVVAALLLPPCSCNSARWHRAS